MVASELFFNIFLIIIFKCGASDLTLPVDKILEKSEDKTFSASNHILKSDSVSTLELIRHCGFECEQFDVITEDGYILKLFHIIGKHSQHLPILLQHGTLDSSDVFLVRGNNSLGINLTQSGYDVWIGNSRENRYSRRHVSYNPDTDKEFWDFTFHENGYYDYPALIDFVLKRTGKSQVIFVAYSQGTMNTFVMGATRPEYNEKIKVFIALSPVCFLKHMKGPDAFAPVFLPVLYTALTLAGQVEVLNYNCILTKFIRGLCTANLEFGYALCGSAMFAGLGFDPEEFEPEFLPVVLKHYFTGVSVKLIAHMAQVMNTYFGWFDFGPEKNMIKYGARVPPPYDLSKFTSKIVLMVAKNDYISTELDTIALAKVLPNATYFVMPREKFNHIDFVWSKNMKKNFLPYFHKFLNKYK